MGRFGRTLEIEEYLKTAENDGGTYVLPLEIYPSAHMAGRGYQLVAEGFLTCTLAVKPRIAAPIL